MHFNQNLFLLHWSQCSSYFSIASLAKSILVKTLFYTKEHSVSFASTFHLSTVHASFLTLNPLDACSMFWFMSVQHAFTKNFTCPVCVVALSGMHPLTWVSSTACLRKWIFLPYFELVISYVRLKMSFMLLHLSQVMTLQACYAGNTLSTSWEKSYVISSWHNVMIASHAFQWVRHNIHSLCLYMHLNFFLVINTLPSL